MQSVIKAEKYESEELISDFDDPEPDNDTDLQHDTTKKPSQEKSREIYNRIYKRFMDWKHAHSLKTEICEDDVLGYMNNLALDAQIKPTTLSSHFSMLKITVNLHNNIDIGTYSRVKDFLKKKNQGYKKQRCKAFTAEQVKRFLTTAGDETWLCMKVVIIFGVIGALRRGELRSIAMEDITEEDSCYLVNIPETKTDEPRTFAITGSLYDITRKYIALRPKNLSPDHFFVKYRNDKCYHQNIGIHMFGTMPKTIATFLRLPDPHLFTGHSFRVTSTKIYAMVGASRRDLASGDPFESGKFARGYDQALRVRRKRICDNIGRIIFNSDPLGCSYWSPYVGVPEAGTVYVPEAGIRYLPEAETGDVPEAATGDVPETDTGDIPEAETAEAQVVQASRATQTSRSTQTSPEPQTSTEIQVPDIWSTIVMEDKATFDHFITDLAESQQSIEMIFD